MADTWRTMGGEERLPRAAGKVTAIAGETAKACLELNAVERPATPPHIRKYRREHQMALGQRSIHPGMYDDVQAQAKQGALNNTYGVRSDHSRLQAGDLLQQAGTTSVVEQVNLEKAEACYKRAAREPLGRSAHLGAELLPDKVRQDEFAFGVPSAKDDDTTRSLLTTSVEDDEASRALYRKSHGGYDPGEQRSRGYDWPFDAEHKVFGVRGEENSMNNRSAGVSAVLRGEGDEPATRLIDKRVEDFRNTRDVLGRSRNIGQMSTNLPRGFMFGRIKASDEPSAAECIRGNYALEDQLPDKDLGTTITPGFRNITTETRAFGVPSIRTDLPNAGAGRRSLADNSNFGDGVTASDLLRPSEFADLAVDDDCFDAPRNKTDMRRIIGSVVVISDSEFDNVWQVATANGGDDACISIEHFRAHLNEYLDAKETNSLEEWEKEHL